MADVPEELKALYAEVDSMTRQPGTRYRLYQLIWQAYYIGYCKKNEAKNE